MNEEELKLIGLEPHPIPILDTKEKVERLWNELEEAIRADAEKWKSVRLECLKRMQFLDELIQSLQETPVEWPRKRIS